MVKDVKDQLKKSDGLTKNRRAGELNPLASNSETTIYERAIRDDGENMGVPEQVKRLSNSSEEVEGLDTNDETVNGEMGAQVALFNRMNITDSQNVDFVDGMDLSGGQRDGQRPSTSGGAQGRAVDMRQRMQSHHVRQQIMTPEEKAEKLMSEADANKARKASAPGKPFDWDIDLNKQFHSVLVDEDFLLVAAHVDTTVYNKIISGEHVDFARLIPRDRVAQEDDHRMKMIFRGGQPYWVPAHEKEVQSIVNF